MEKNPFLQMLDKFQRLNKEQSELADLVQWSFKVSDTKAAYDLSLRLEELTERSVLLSRSLPAYTGNPRSVHDVEAVIGREIPVEIGFTEEGWFSLRMPLLLPKKEHGSANYIRSIVYPAMEGFFRDKPPVRFRDCVLIYRHLYSRNRPERQRRDHDNIEVNMLSDTIALYVMPDDGPEICCHYYCSAAAQTERTEVYVVPQTDFPYWFESEKKMPEEGVKLYETKLSKAEIHM